MAPRLDAWLPSPSPHPVAPAPPPPPFQVTNPAIDPFREAVVTSLRCFIGPEGDITVPLPGHAARLDLEQPVLTMAECEALKHVAIGGWAARVIYTSWALEEGPAGLQSAA